MNGITCSKSYPSIDFLRFSTIQILKNLLNIEDSNDITLEVRKRSIRTDFHGSILLKLPIKAKIEAKAMESIGKFDRFRGLIWSINVPPEISKRAIKAAKDILCRFSTNFYVSTDFTRDPVTKNKGKQGCAFGFILYAETKFCKRICSEANFVSYNDNDTFDPEKIGINVASDLLHNLYKKSFVDEINQTLLILKMALSESHVSSLRLGTLTQESKILMRYLDLFFNHRFILDIEPIQGNTSHNAYILKCMGTGYANYNRLLL
ncbi:MAG: rRNA-processing endoribonuclease [Paramarteilia canceri]